MTRHDNTQLENTTQHQPHMLCETVLGCCNHIVEVKCWEVLQYVVVCDLLWCAVLGGSVLWSHEVRRTQAAKQSNVATSQSKQATNPPFNKLDSQPHHTTPHDTGPTHDTGPQHMSIDHST